jgi:ribonucleoside-diphosphate reductase beta chain
MTDSLSFYLEDVEKWRSERRIIESSENLINPNNKRDSLYPILYPKIWDFYRKHFASFWIPQDVDLSKDKNDWINCNKDEKYYIKHVLAFFAGSDFIVNESQKKDGEEITILEHQFFNDDKIARENLHSLSYAELLDEYVKDDKERTHLKNAVTTMKAISDKAKWFREFITDGTFVERLIGGAVMEGIFFSGSFCAIYWLKKRGVMPGLCDLNEFIARDEGLHRDFNCYLYREEIQNKLPEDILIHIIKSAVVIEQESVKDSLPVSLIGMNDKMMCEYIEYTADHLFLNLIGKRVYNTPNPFEDWMAAIGLNVKADFFVHRPTSYGIPSAVTDDKTSSEIRFDENF